MGEYTHEGECWKKIKASDNILVCQIKKLQLLLFNT